MKILKCHCGEVEIQVDLKKEIDQLKRCNCSMCKRKGTMVTTAVSYTHLRAHET